MSVNITKDKKNWYCIKFDVPKNRNITALEFSKKMNLFLEQINEFNHSIVNGIDDTYTVASYIEDFESGSIKWWLLDKLNKIDDKAIEKFVDSPIKNTIAGILKLSKKKTIEYLSNNDYQQISVEERKMKIINPIIEEIELKQEELNKNILIPKAIKIDENRLLNSLCKMSKISRELEENISFISDYDNQSEQIIISKNLNNDYFINTQSVNETKSEELSSKEYEHIFSIVSCVFKKRNKWRLFDGNNEINAFISDNSFLNDIENGDISFSQGDRLFCRVKTTQFETVNGLKTEYEILEIKKHIKRPEQLNLSQKMV